MNKIIVSITGATGNMGKVALEKILEIDEISKIKILVLNKKRDKRIAKGFVKKYGKNRIKIIFGNISDISVCRELVKDSNYVFNFAAVIPPIADHNPKQTIECNYFGVKALVAAIEEIDVAQPKLIHISTVAVYGNRNYLHPWGEVADPLLPSVYDTYGMSKIRGERVVLESSIKTWVVLRQTGMLHKNIFKDNLSDGLMFHTCFNVPMEWVTAEDSGRLVKHLIIRDLKNEINDFWRKVYNIGGGAECRITGYDTFKEGFEIIGGTTENFMLPGWNAIRNFHCMWFLDSDVLEDLFKFRADSVHSFWEEVLKVHPYFKLAKLVSPKIISRFAIQRLLSNKNSPVRWIKDGEEGKIKAFFGSKENINCMGVSWSDYPVLAKSQLPDAYIDYESMRDIKNAISLGYKLQHGYDESKKDSELDIEDMRTAAEFRGGKCLSPSMTKGDLYTKLEWECHDGHKFFATPYTVLKAGHWCPECCEKQGEWDFDKLAKVSPFHAQIWYDTHSVGENYFYYFDDKYNAKFKVLGGLI